MTTQQGPTVITIEVKAKELYESLQLPAPSVISQIKNLKAAYDGSSDMPDIKEYCCVKDNQDNKDYVCGEGIKTMLSGIFPDSMVIWQGKLASGSNSDYTLRLDMAVIDKASSVYFDKVVFIGNETHIVAFTREKFEALPEESYLILLTITPKKGNSEGSTFVLDPILKGIYK